jgi:FkbM family methyltransferase
VKETIKKLLKLSPIGLTQNHRYDLQTKKIILRLPSDANCIDVGCFKGEILDHMLKAAPRGQHFALEPIPGLFAALERKYTDQKSCTLLNYAASNTAGTASFNHVISNPSYSGLKKRDYDKPNEQDRSIEVKTERLDALIPEGLPIHLIKIDVEGAELLVLEGAERIIRTYRPIVIFEHGLGASEHYGAGPEQIFAYFAEKNMQVNNLGRFLKKKPGLAKEEFQRQYEEREEFCFVASGK